MKIIISGLTATGKSTLVRGLSQEFGLEYFSASSKWKDIMPKKDFVFWESKKGLDALKFRLSHLKYDRMLDDFILKHVASHDNIIIDSWVASWKIDDKDTIKIYLRADLETRARRVVVRDGILYKDALDFMKKKDKLSTKIYYKLYKIKIDRDMYPFKLVVDNSHLSVEAMRALCSSYIRNFSEGTKAP
jgi:cytidylate kinase